MFMTANQKSNITTPSVEGIKPMHNCYCMTQGRIYGRFVGFGRTRHLRQRCFKNNVKAFSRDKVNTFWTDKAQK